MAELKTTTPHAITVKVYYEDTDAGGVVYYAKYLGFMERARTEFLAERGIDVGALHREGLFFAVAHVDITYKRPARLGDVLTVTTEVVERKNASMIVKNRVMRGEELLTDAVITFVCITPAGKPQRLPEAFNVFAAS